MFKQACELARHFVRPAYIAVQTYDGQVGAGIGAFVVINSDGWAVTAAHMVKEIIQCNADKGAIGDYDQKMALISAETNPSRAHTAKKKLDREIGLALRNRDLPYIRRAGILWSTPTVAALEDHAHPIEDIMVVKLDNVADLGVDIFPKFKRPIGVVAGTSIVRSGYAFNETKCRYDDASHRFVNETTSSPLFASEGIISRNLIATEPTSGTTVYMVQTSTPGLKGQSGGPLLDSEGAILAIQSTTVCLDLQFNAESADHNGQYKERQFLNVGQGISTETLENIFAQHGIVAEWVD